MPDISAKGKQMPASPIRKLVPFAEEARRKGRKVYHLNIGQPDIETPENALDAIRNFKPGVIEYSHSAGNESYRRKVLEYYAKAGIRVGLENIIVTTGGSEAIIATLITCLNPGDEIIIPEPFYANYNSFAVIAGITVKPVTSFIETGFALPPVAEFEKRITPKTRAILICNPGNPTGYLYTKEELFALRDLVKKHDLFLFADEVYREFCYDGREHFSTLHLEGLDEHVVMVDSVSKRYSMCGARIGTIVTRNRAVFDACMRYAHARLSPPTLGQVGAEAAVDTPPDYFRKVKEEYVKRRDFVVRALGNMEGVVCPKPGGAFYAIAALPVDDADTFCRWLLETFEYDNQTVMLAPASGFYSTSGLGKQEVRIAYVLNLDALRSAMQCLEKALEEYPGRTMHSPGQKIAVKA